MNPLLPSSLVHGLYHLSFVPCVTALLLFHPYYIVRSLIQFIMYALRCCYVPRTVQRTTDKFINKTPVGPALWGCPFPTGIPCTCVSFLREAGWEIFISFLILSSGLSPSSTLSILIALVTFKHEALMKASQTLGSVRGLTPVSYSYAPVYMSQHQAFLHEQQDYTVAVF